MAVTGIFPERLGMCHAQTEWLCRTSPRHDTADCTCHYCDAGYVRWMEEPPAVRVRQEPQGFRFPDIS